MSEILQPLSFPLTGTRLIEASAGTGKTYTLAALYVRLVLGHGDNSPPPLLPPDLLVVTFTEAATRELRDRIRARLAEAARCFAGRDTASDPFLSGLMASYPSSQHGQCASRLDAAAQWMDEAAIYTIHGFCNRMLRQHAFDSGSLFTLELNQDEKALQEQACADYWRTFFYPLDEQQSASLRTVWRTPTDLLRNVRPLLGDLDHLPAETMEPAERIQQNSETREQLVDEARQRWLEWTRDLLKKMEAAWQDGRMQKSKPSNSANFRRWLGEIQSWAADMGTGCINVNESLLKHLTPESLAAANPNIAEIVNHDAVAHLHELATLPDSLPQLRPALLPHACHWIARRIDQYKRQHGMIGYSDMLSRLRDALVGAHGDRLANSIRQQFPVAMIDEFQDTDPVQYQVFSRLYQDQPDTTWLMIGDPKQAIYAFRGADIHTYLAARRATEGQHYTLDTNFRSTTSMVAATNHLFDSVRNSEQGAFLHRDIPFSPVVAKGRRDRLLIDSEPATAMTLWHLLSDQEDDNSFTKSRYGNEMAARTASEIVRLLTLASSARCGFEQNGIVTPLRPADIAILVRSGREADKIRAALSQRGLRSVYLSDKDSVFASAEAQDLLSWMQAAAEPASEQRLRAALATATLQQSWQRLEQLSRDEVEWEREVERFHGYHREWQRLGVLPMIRRLLKDFHVPAQLLSQDRERSLTNLLHLAELAQKAASKLDGEQALVRWLAESIDGAGIGDTLDEQVLRLESDDDLIRIVTIHKSKGLEYPLVFLPFVCNFRNEDGKHPPLRFHDDIGRLQLTLTPSQAEIARADRERLAEDLRLLYVAVTRARHACWLGMAAVRKGRTKNQCDLAQSAIGYLLGAGQPLAAQDVALQLQQLAARSDSMAVMPAPDVSQAVLPAATDNPALHPARRYQGPSPERWWIASYSALEPGARDHSDSPRYARDEVLAEEKSAAGTRPGADLQDNRLHGFIRGPQAGTFLHGLLEWCAQTGFDAVTNNRQPDLLLQIQRRSRLLAQEHQANPLLTWLSDYLSTPLPFADQSVTLVALPRGHYQAEMEFWIQSSRVSTEALDALVRRHVLPGQPRPALREDQLNGMLKGFIDLVLEQNGRYYVADYKSNWLGPDDNHYSQQAMARVVLDKRYDIQLCLYLLALHRLLGSRLGEQYQPEQQLGGAALLFLRGHRADSGGVYFQSPLTALVTELDQLFRGQPVMESDHVH
ncbi:MAG: exodeoxyribonuclease V subunit beta [Alcanivoracaceae bacterium]